MPTRKRLLVVDDDHEMVGLLRDFLTREGYSVETADSAKVALSAFQESGTSGRPALVISDVKMGPMSGFELTIQLLSHNPTLPVILFSVFSSAELEQEARKVGARTLLRKPFALKELAALIKKELDKTII